MKFTQVYGIRNIEPTWEKVHGLKFQLMLIRMELSNGGYRLIPCVEMREKREYTKKRSPWRPLFLRVLDF